MLDASDELVVEVGDDLPRSSKDLVADVGHDERGGTTLPTTTVFERPDLFEVTNRGSHALRRHTDPPSEVTGRQFGSGSEVTERAEVAEGDAVAGEVFVESIPQA